MHTWYAHCSLRTATRGQYSRIVSPDLCAVLAWNACGAKLKAALETTTTAAAVAAAYLEERILLSCD
jgi:hypothetical protein